MHGIESDNKNQKRGTKMKLTDKIHKKKNTQEIENFTDLVKARYSSRSMSERKVEKENLIISSKSHASVRLHATCKDSV